MLVFDTIQSVREVPRDLSLGPQGVYMPATKADLVELRHMQYFLENPDTHYPVEVKRKHIDALKRMLHTIEYGDPHSPCWWAAAALKRSMKKASPTLYVCDDRELQTWALDQIFSMFPDDDEHQPAIRSGH